jgi:ABC-type transport system involved in multi-copper enzyme maturation permease subunit
MVARLWWKDARQFWPIWALLAVLALAIQGLLLQYAGPSARAGELTVLAVFWTSLYGCAVAAAGLAGERENRTLQLLDALSAERWRVWAAKASFALVSTFALGVFVFVPAALATDKWEFSTPWSSFGLGAMVLLMVLGWGLFWSAALGNALLAAVVAVCSALLTLPGFDSMLNLYLSMARHYPVWIAIALATLSASAILFIVMGPPQRPLIRRSVKRLRSRSSASTGGAARLSDPRPPYARAAAQSLAWQTVRDVRSLFIWLVPIAVILPAVMNPRLSEENVPACWLICNLIGGLLAGISVFGTDNRSRSQAFLAGNGLRPGLVWVVKTLVWLTALGSLWAFCVFLLIICGLERVRGPVGPGEIVPVLAGVLLSTVSVALLCGMAIRRGITAGVVSVLAWWLVVFPLLMLFGARVLPAGFLLLFPVVVLAVSYGWSREWLMDRPGARRWLTLALLLVGSFGIYFAGYAAYRVGTVPVLDPVLEARTFSFSASPPIAESANAANLYREAARLIPPPRLESEISRGLKPEELKPLELLRQASAVPSCRFVSLDRLTTFTELDNEAASAAIRLLLYLESSISRQIARGDLDAAWSDLLAMLRMARHHGGAVPLAIAFNGLIVERKALGLAMQWAADPRQTVERLHAAIKVYQELPAMPSATEPIRAEAKITRNTEAMPRSELAGNLLAMMSGPRKDADLRTNVWVGIMTSPWELARARRASRLLYASKIEEAGHEPWYTERTTTWNVGGWAKLQIIEDTNGAILAPATLEEIYESTPLTARLLTPVNGFIQYWDRNEVARRALRYLLALRAWQIRHDGSLPVILNEVYSSEHLDIIPTDPYTPNKPFGYVRSTGQSLLPLGDLDPLQPGHNPGREPHRTDGSWVLLYSIGPDLKDDFAQMNDIQGGTGDIIFPLFETNTPPKDETFHPGGKPFSLTR